MNQVGSKRTSELGWIKLWMQKKSKYVLGPCNIHAYSSVAFTLRYRVTFAKHICRVYDDNKSAENEDCNMASGSLKKTRPTVIYVISIHASQTDELLQTTQKESYFFRWFVCRKVACL